MTKWSTPGNYGANMMGRYDQGNVPCQRKDCEFITRMGWCRFVGLRVWVLQKKNIRCPILDLDENAIYKKYKELL